MNPSHPAPRWTLFAGACLGLAGCAPAAPPAPPPPAVSVSLALEQEVIDYSKFTGRTAAVHSVQVRSHVWGYIDKVNFKEGDNVDENHVLFKIDRRPYDHALAQAEALLKQAEAPRQHGGRAGPRPGVPRRHGAGDGEPGQGQPGRGQGGRQLRPGRRDYAQLNVTYTDVVAPVSGRVSRAMLTEGNLVQSGDQGGGTLLTTIVSVKPMWVYFDVDDLTYLRVSPMLREAEIHSESGPKVDLGLISEDRYPRHGTIDFVDNQVDPGTGTIRMRGVFQNEDALLIPGLFVRVQVPLEGKHQAVLVSDPAVDTDQGQKVVYVVGPDNVAEKRPVRLGGLHDDVGHVGLRELKSGVKRGERVIVDGIQWVRAGRRSRRRWWTCRQQTRKSGDKEKGRNNQSF